MYFQDLILTLQRYWNERGCLFIQPYDMEKGAATFNPSTWLRALGPEPFFAAFAEPCRRPRDGRYGDNPIRMQHYYQYQVVLKPSPPDILELYLGSLAAIGVHPSDHDIRFVHDDWESPTLGAWGLGWEVWVDGMEVSQFTYFQQVGGIELAPVSGEITYGLERLCMYLQGKRSVFDLDYNASFKYGDLFHQAEVQGSKHNFEVSDAELHFELFRRFEIECQRLCDAELPLVAADYCLKASHAFNLLDARGAISVNERQNYILKVRQLARTVAEAYLKNREALGFPWVGKQRLTTAASTAEAIPAAPTPTTPPPERAPLLVELGVEEMPAKVFDSLLEQLPQLFAKHVGGLNLDPQDVQVMVTPRRIAISVASMRTRQPDQTLEVKGPPLRVAKDASGAWTKAATAFAAKQNLPLEKLVEKDVAGTGYLMAIVAQQGRPAAEVLATAIPALFADIHWYKTMRWGSGTTQFVRPVQWLLALLGDQVLPVTFAGVTATHCTHGHRFLSNHAYPVSADRATYQQTLRDLHVIVDHVERKELLRHALTDQAVALGLRWHRDEELLQEVTHLVEFPLPVLCAFDESFLAVPAPVLVTEMKAHQKYLALEQLDGTLSNQFIAVSNSLCVDMGLVRQGYENVLVSRFADAKFFLAEDQKHTLASRVPALAKVVYQQRLGTIHDKVERNRRLAAWIATKLNLGVVHVGTIDQIAALCKADLDTAMVGEFPELQGEVGRYYALREGLPPVVADGIRDHYRPKGLSDEFPGSMEAAIVGLADRLDSLAGFFAIGKVPSSTADPYALRRACVTSLALILKFDLRLDLGELLLAALLNHDAALPFTPGALAAHLQGGTPDKFLLVTKHVVANPGEVLKGMAQFALTRLEGLLADAPRSGLPGGYAVDTIRAVLPEATQLHDLTDLVARITALATFRQRPDFAAVAATFKRVNNITDRAVTGAPELAVCKVESERTLLVAVAAAETVVLPALAARQYVNALAAIEPLRVQVDRFFDDVMVNDPDPALKANRHRLLHQILSLVLRVADFSAIQEG